MDQRRQLFAQRLRTLRKNKGFTQKELGKLLSVTDAAVGMWEQARRLPDPEMLTRLAEVFDVSVDWLLGRVMQNKNCELDEFLNSLNHKHSEKSKEVLAAHRSDDPTQELPEEARRSLEEFKEYILKKYSKK